VSLPWIKFEAVHWLNGKISRCSALEKGIFIELVVKAMTARGVVPWDDLEAEIFAEDNSIEKQVLGNCLSKLSRRGIIQQSEASISIKFVCEAIARADNLAEKRRLAGRKGGKAKASASKCQAIAQQKEANSSDSSNLTQDLDTHTHADTIPYTGLPVVLGEREPLYREFIESYKKHGGGINLNPSKVRSAMAAMDADTIRTAIDAIPNAGVFNRDDKGCIPCGSRYLSEEMYLVTLTEEEKKKGHGLAGDFGSMPFPESEEF